MNEDVYEMKRMQRRPLNAIDADDTRLSTDIRHRQISMSRPRVSHRHLHRDTCSDHRHAHEQMMIHRTTKLSISHAQTYARDRARNEHLHDIHTALALQNVPNTHEQVHSHKRTGA